MKQIGLGNLQYTQDYDETLQLRSMPGNNWMNILQPYMKSAQVFQCPSDNNKNRTSQAPGYWPAGFAPYRTSYIYNRNLAPGSTAAPVGLSIAAVTNVATTVLVTDGGGVPDPAKAPHLWTVEPLAWLLDDSGGSGTSNDDAYAGPLARHAEMANVAWVDGHAKAHKVPTFYRPGGISPCLQYDKSTTPCP